MPIIKSGNLDEKIKDHPETKGWLVGHFVKFDPFFKTNDLEVKWAVHHKGDIKPGAIAKSTAKTLVILIKGKFAVRFPDLGKEIILSKTGDYLAYDASKVMHTAESLEDSVLITIRWPSKR
ncbi:MAG: signal peptidase I [bacterium]|nr:signal peptidase I [bacterium]